MAIWQCNDYAANAKKKTDKEKYVAQNIIHSDEGSRK